MILLCLLCKLSVPFLFLTVTSFRFRCGWGASKEEYEASLKKIMTVKTVQVCGILSLSLFGFISLVLWMWVYLCLCIVCFELLCACTLRRPYRQSWALRNIHALDSMCVSKPQTKDYYKKYIQWITHVIFLYLCWLALGSCSHEIDDTVLYVTFLLIWFSDSVIWIIATFLYWIFKRSTVNSCMFCSFRDRSGMNLMQERQEVQALFCPPVWSMLQF